MWQERVQENEHQSWEHNPYGPLVHKHPQRDEKQREEESSWDGRVEVPRPRRRSPVSTFVQDNVEVKNLALGPENSLPEERVDSDCQCETNNETDDAIADETSDAESTDGDVHQDDNAEQEGELAAEDEDGNPGEEDEEEVAIFEPEGEGEKNENQGEGIWERSGGVEHKVELGNGEKDVPIREARSENLG